MQAQGKEREVPITPLTRPQWLAERKVVVGVEEEEE